MNQYQNILLVIISLCYFCEGIQFEDYLVYSPNPISILNLKNTIEEKSSPLSITLLPIKDQKQYGYASHENGILSIIDISNLQQAIVLKSLQLTPKQVGKGLQVSHDNSLLWYIKKDIVEVISIRDPINPFLLFTIEKQQDADSQSAHFVNIEILPNNMRVFILRFKRFDIIDLSFDILKAQLFNKPINNDAAYQLIKSFIQSNGGEVRFIQYPSDFSLLITSDSQDGLVIYSSSSTNFQVDQNPNFKRLCSRVATIGLTHKIKLIQDRFLYVLDTSTGLSLYDISQIIGSKKCGLSVDINGVSSKEYLVLIDQDIQTYTLNTLIVTKKEDYAIVLRSDMAVVYDLRDRSKLIKHQEIPIKTDAINISQSYQEDYFSVTGFNTISFYLRTQQNFNKNAPNLLNIYQSYNYYEVQNDQWGYSCKFDENRQILFDERNYDGVYLFSVGERSLDLKQVGQIKPPLSNWQAGAVHLIHNGQVMIVGYNRFGVILYDISDLSQIKELSRSNLTGNVNQDSDLIAFSSNEQYMLVANGFMGITMVDISDVTQPNVLWSETFDIGYQSYEGVAIDKNTKYAYACARAYGIFSFDISMIQQKPILISTIRSRGAESLILTSDGKFLIVADGLYGVQIITVNSNGIITTISQIHLDSHIWKVSAILDDNYLLTSQKGQKASILIDINDKSNPIILQKLAYPDLTNTFDICMKKNLEQLYYITLRGVYAIQTLPKITLHTERTQTYYNEFGQLKVQSLSRNEKLKVGSKIDFSIIQIRQQLKIKISKALIYADYQLKELPFWIQFSYEFWQASLQISKEGLIATQDGDFVESHLYLVLIIFEEIQSNSFLDDVSGIGSNLSISIYENCISQGIITKSGFPTFQPILDAQSNYMDPNLTSKQAQFVSNVLKNKVIYYPISFIITPSLSFNFDSLNYDQDKIAIINSLQEQVSLTLVFPHKQAIFWDTKYLGVLVSLSQEQDKLKLEGSLNSVNQVLKQKIRVIILKDSPDIIINLNCQDNQNYPIKSTQTLSKISKIISKNNEVLQNPQLSVQQDFANQFQNSEVYIKTVFKYQINKNTFIDKDGDSLSFEVQMLDENSSQDDGKEISADSWIQYSPEGFQIQGNPGYDMFRSSVKLKIIASDGFSSSYQILEIKVMNVPLSIVFTFLLSIISPIIGIFGFTRYKYLLHNLLNHSSLMFYKDVTYVGEVYQKQIPLIEIEVFPLAKYIWKLYQIEWQKIYIKEKLNLMKQQSQNICLEKQFYPQINHGNLNSPLNNLSITSNNNVEKIFDSDHQSLKQEKGNQVFFQITNKAKKIENKLLKKALNLSLSKKQKVESVNNSQLKASRYCDNNNQKYNDEEQNNENCLFFQNQFNKQYLINSVREHIIKLCEGKNPPLKLKAKREYIIYELSNKNSRLSIAITSIAIQKMLLKDEYTLNFFQYLKEMTISTFGINSLFYPYIKITPDINNLKQNPYPLIEVNQQKLNEAEQYLIEKHALLNNSSLLSPILLCEAILSQAYGFSILKPQSDKKSQGISIHSSPQNVSSIKAFLKQDQSPSKFIQRYGLEYKQVSLSHNLSLPSWITTVDLIHGVILISGVPEAKDYGQTLIRIYDQKQYILLQFILEVRMKNQEIINNSQQIPLNQENYNQIVSPEQSLSEEREIPFEEVGKNESKIIPQQEDLYKFKKESNPIQNNTKISDDNQN